MEVGCGHVRAGRVAVGRDVCRAKCHFALFALLPVLGWLLSIVTPATTPTFAERLAQRAGIAAQSAA